MTEVPFDEWTNVPNVELNNRGKAQWVYRPSNYTGPLAIDGVICKETVDAPGACITLTREEAEIIWPKK